MLALEGGWRIIDRLLVGDLLEAAIVDDADQAFMQDIKSLHQRPVMAGDQAVRIERDRLGAAVRHRVVDAEHIFVVDRDGAGEFKSLAVVVRQRERRALRQRSRRVRRPQRVGSGKCPVLVSGGADEAMLGVVGVWPACWRQEDHHRARRLDRLAIVLQRQIVDAGALQRDRALEARRVDGDARALRQGLRAGHRRGRGGAGLQRRARGSLSARLRLRRAGLHRLRLLGRRHRRRMLRHEEKLPGEQHADGQNDSQDEVAVVLVHVAFGSVARRWGPAWLTWERGR